jgi:hypothetical protein
MNRLFLATAFVSLLVTNSWATSNLNLSKSNINRYLPYPNAALTTATANVPAGGTVQVYTTPVLGDFILTQFCASPDAIGGVRLNAVNFGDIAQTVNNGVSCFTFTPGVSIPKNSALTCSNGGTSVPNIATSSAANYFCTISGMAWGQ